MQVSMLVVATAGASYVGGRAHGWVDRRETEAQLNVAVEEHRRAFGDANATHAKELARLNGDLRNAHERLDGFAELTSWYEARRRTDAALEALDARNFEVAAVHLRSAEQIVEAVDAPIDGLTTLRSRLDATNMLVAEDVVAQREAVRMVREALDEIITRALKRRAPELLSSADEAFRLDVPDSAGELSPQGQAAQPPSTGARGHRLLRPR